MTGASQGIGRAIAEKLMYAGAHVALFARNQQALEEVAVPSPAIMLAVAGDVIRKLDLERLVSETRARFGRRIDLVIPCAGIAKMVPVEHVTHEILAAHMETNCWGAIQTVQLCVPYMQRGGSSVYITTSMTQGGFAGLAPYGASKDALQGWMRCQAVELAEKGIRVSAIAPGPTDTPMWPNIGLPPEQLQQVAATVSNRLLSKKFGSPEAIAQLTLEIAQSEYVYGQEFVADGGYSIH